MIDKKEEDKKNRSLIQGLPHYTLEDSEREDRENGENEIIKGML